MKFIRKFWNLLKDGTKTLAEIRASLSYSHSGSLTQIINNLVVSGFITKYYQWSLRLGSPSKQSLYRISDCYTRFYLKYIKPNRDKIERDYYKDLNLNALPGWDFIMGFQIESLLLQNRLSLLKSIGIDPSDIVGDNPYYQSKTARKSGCQVDY